MPTSTLEKQARDDTVSLINDQQRDNSNISKPEIKPVRTVAQTPVDIAVPPPLEPASEPESEQFQGSFVQPMPQSGAQEFAAEGASPMLPETKPGDLPYFTPTPVPETPAPPAQITPLPSILSDVTQEFGKGSQWNPTIVNNKLPTVYISEPSNRGYNQALEGLGAAVTGYNKQAADAYAEAERTTEKLRTSTPNVPQTEKNWVQSGLAFLSDVAFGSKQAQERTEQGNYNPIVGEFGRQGAGLGGGIKWLLNTGGNLAAGVLSETIEAQREAWRAVGLSEEQARAAATQGLNQGVAGGWIPKTGNAALDLITGANRLPLDFTKVIGFNWSEALKRNSVVDALRGDDVADINDPKESTELGTGRVFYSPRRKVGQSATDDPISYALQVGTWLLSPGEIPADIVVGRVVNEVSKRTIAPIGRKLGRAIGITEAASKPVSEGTTVTRVAKGETNVISTPVKPVVTETNLPLKPTNKPPTPTHLASEVGLGKPSTQALEVPANVKVRSYEETLAELRTTKPQALEGYNGNSWQELKTHLGKTDADLSEFTSVRLADDADVFDPTKLTYDDLVNANDELAGHKFVLDAQVRQLDDVLDDSIDFGRRTSNDLGYRQTTTDELLETLENGGKPNLHPESFTKIAPDVADAIRTADYDRLRQVLSRSGANLSDELTAIVTENNRILSEPMAIADQVPTEALTQLPKSLYHGTALDNWQPGYNVSVNGSRGELGHGLYLTKDSKVATDYARARMGENVSPATLDINLKPSVYQVEPTLTRTLDARANLSKATIDTVIEGLPEEIVSPLKRSLARQKNNTYNGILAKVEAAIVKGGLDPSEDILTSTQRTIANNLRKLGYDSVYDGKSGFALVLDETKVRVSGRESMQTPTAMEATLARYNADAYAAKQYRGRLTADANLRDSTAKLLNQMNANVDDKLADVQQALIQRQTARLTGDGLLPETNLYPSTTPKPKNVNDIMAQVDELADDLCSL